MKILAKDLSDGQNKAVTNVDVTTAGLVTTANVFSGLGLDLTTQSSKPANVGQGLWLNNSNELRFYDGSSDYEVAHSATALVGDVTGTLGATVVGNDSHTHANGTLTGVPGAAIDTTALHSGDSTGGDLSGTYPTNIAVDKIQGSQLAASISPSSGDVLTWGGSDWDAAAPAGLGANFIVVDSSITATALNAALAAYDVVYAEPGTYNGTGMSSTVITVPDSHQFVALGAGAYLTSATYCPRFDLTTSGSAYFALGINALIQGMYFEFNAGSAGDMIKCSNGGAVRNCFITGDTGGTAYYGISGGYNEITHIGLINCYGINLSATPGDSAGTVEISYIHWQAYTSSSSASNIGLNNAVADVFISNCEFQGGAYGIKNSGHYVQMNHIKCYDVDDATNSYAIYSTGTDGTFADIRIEGSNVGASYGLYATGHYCQFSDVYSNYTGSSGFYFNGDYCLVDGVYAYRCGTTSAQHGIEFNGSQNMTAANLTAYLCGDKGIELINCTQSTFAGITANYNVGDGLHVYVGNTDCTFSGITANSNGGDGVDVDASQDGLHFAGVTAMSNTGWGFLGGNSGTTRVCRLSDCHALSNSSGQISLGTSWQDYSTPSGISTISAATDTDISSPASGDLLLWDGSNSWDNKALSGDATILSTGVITVTGSTAGFTVGTLLTLNNYGASPPTGSGDEMWVDNSGLNWWDAGSGGASKIVDATTIFAGDVTGTYSNNLVSNIQGDAVDTGSPATDDKFVWDGSEWHHSSTSRVRAYLNSNQSISNATYTTVQFANETFDFLGDFNTGTYRFVAPVTGHYIVQAKLALPATADVWYGYINHNGSRVTEIYHLANTTTITTMAIDDVISMASGQYLEIQVIQISGGSLNVNAGSNHTYFTVTRVV